MKYNNFMTKLNGMVCTGCSIAGGEPEGGVTVRGHGDSEIRAWED